MNDNTALREWVRAQGGWYASNDAAVQGAIRKKIRGALKVTGSRFRCLTPDVFNETLGRLRYSRWNAGSLHAELQKVGVTASALAGDCVAVVLWTPRDPYVSCVISNMTCIILDSIGNEVKVSLREGTIHLGPTPTPKNRRANKKARWAKFAALKERVGDEGVSVTPSQIRTALSESGCGLRPFVLDTDFLVTVPAPLMDDLLSFNRIDERTYVAQDYDCDNFALDLWYWMGQKIGVTAFGRAVDFSGRHSYCIRFDAADDGTIAAAPMEPQTDKTESFGTGMFAGSEGYVEVIA